MTLEEEIAKVASRLISDEIDAAIIFSLLLQRGWHTCDIDSWRHSSQSDVIQWCKKYAGEHSWVKSGNQFAFKDARVATMFRIHWS